ncbi:MAG: hypothetical protein Q7S48_03775 [bacterium]|nr:hypothetical protein [bacterium]
MSAERPVPPEARGEHPEPKKSNPIKKWAQRIALGAAMAGGGYQVGHEQGKAEMLQPEQERIEQEAEELAEELDDMISLIDDVTGIGIIVNEEGKRTQLRTHYRVELTHAVGMTSDFALDSSQSVTWQKSPRADEIYKKIESILERGYDLSDSNIIQIRSAAQKIMQDKGK